MWACSRSSSTGWPLTATSKSGGPNTRSERIALGRGVQLGRRVAGPRSAWARPCSNETHGGLRNGRIAMATIDDRRRDGRQERGDAGERRSSPRGHGSAAVGLGRSRPAGSGLLERLRLLPPAGAREVARAGRRLSSTAARAIRARKSSRLEREDVAQSLDPGLHQQVVLGRPEARRGSASAPRRATRGRRSSSP